jgi:hypothetical protein
MSRQQFYPGRSSATATFTAGHEIQDRWHLLAGLLDRLLHGDGDGDACLNGLNAAELLLQTLPLASEPFGVAMNRIRNARRYLRSREVGAAHFELRLLASTLKRELGD